VKFIPDGVDEWRQEWMVKVHTNDDTIAWPTGIFLYGAI
jgi:hypothetical protein